MKKLNIFILIILSANILFAQTPEEFRKNKGDFNRLFCAITDETTAPDYRTIKLEGHFRFYNTSPYGRISFYYNQIRIELQPNEYSKPFPGKIPSSLPDHNINIDNIPLSNFYRIVDYEMTYQEFSNTITRKFNNQKTISELKSDIVLCKKTLAEMTANTSIVPEWFIEKYYYNHKFNQTNSWLKTLEELLARSNNKGRITEQSDKKSVGSEQNGTNSEKSELVDNVINKIKADQHKQYEAEQHVKLKIELQNESLKASQQVANARDQLMQNSQLQDDYESVEQLIADFNAKQNNVEALMEQLSAERKQQINALSNQMRVDNNASTASYSEAMGDLTNLIGGVVAYNKEQKERKIAYEELERQKKEMLAQIEAKKRIILTNARNDLFQRFKEGVIPTSSTKLDADSIFYFGYYLPTDVGEPNATLEVTTIYPVYRYGDSTWPFKEKIIKEVFVSSAPGVLHGYYRNRAEAEAMRQAFVNVYTRTGGNVKQTLLMTKSAPSSNKYNDDFWEEGKSTTPKSKSQQPKPQTANNNDDFWNK